MSRMASNTCRVCLVDLALVLATFFSGCSSDRSYRSQAESRNVVQRPVYDDDGTKKVYLGGYAGANYDFGPRAAQ